MKNIKLLKNKKGFTLVELVIVIAVLAIIAAIAIPLVSGQIAKANAATDASNAQAYTAAVKLAVAQYELKPGDRLPGYSTAITSDKLPMSEILRLAGVDATAEIAAKQNGYVFVLDDDTDTVTLTKAATGGISNSTEVTLSGGATTNP